MQKIIYSNVIGFLLLVVLPWYVFDKEYHWDIFSFDRNYFIYLMLFGAACLVCMDVVVAIKTRGRKRKTAILLGLLPFLILSFFVFGYFFAFSGFTGF